MVQGYYTLQEASKFLGMPLDDLKQMAQKGQIRSFQDRGTLRFRIQDIQELARTRGAGSDHELALGEGSLPPAKSPSSAAKKSPPKPPSKAGAPDVFDFDVNADDAALGADLPLGGPKSKSASSRTKKANTPTHGSDSDVRLVSDGSDVTFSVPKDSDIKLPDSDVRVAPDPLKPKTGIHTPAPSSGVKRPSQLALGSGVQKKSKLGSGAAPKPAASPRPGSGPQPADSGVRLVPMDDDSDVKLHGSSDDVPLGEAGPGVSGDSNVRLEKVGMPPADSGEDNLLLTEEINLDEEIRKQQEQDQNKPAPRMKAKSELKLPTTSPFELSDSDLDLPSELKSGASGPKTPVKAEADGSDSSDFDLAAQKDGSSDFDLVPAADGSIALEGDSSDFSLEADNDQVIDQQGGELSGPTSGISLDNPVDAGISLEEGDASDFDLSLQVEDTPKPQKSSPADSDSEFELSAQKTPRPQKGQKPAPAEESDSSEFDLSLDADVDGPALQEQGESSEFELNLEGSGEVAANESDGEFELTLDDSGNVEAVQEDAPQVKSKPKAKKKPASAEEQDIFDTDFEVPALEESDDATVADSELESSDFDLALDDSELAQEEESGSQVVALDEEDADTVVDEDAAVVDDVEVEDESSDFADLDQDVEIEDEVEVDEDGEVVTTGKTKVITKTVVQEKLIPPAPWGVMPVIFMLPCVIIMFLVGILGFELVQTTTGLKPPGMLTTALAEQFGTPVTVKK